MKYFLLLLLASCSTTLPLPSPPSPVPSKPDTEIVLAPTVVTYVAIEIVSLTGFTPEQETRFRKIVSNTEAVINEVQFKKEVEGWRWNGKNSFVDTSDTPKQVYSKVTSQSWKLEYRLEKLRPFSKTIGYTYPNVSWIAFNAKKFPVLEDAEIAANICHEYAGHKLGRYQHGQQYTKDRPYSVPYGLGSICERIYKRLFPAM
jgi:hypothetical protein